MSNRTIAPHHLRLRALHIDAPAQPSLRCTCGAMAADYASLAVVVVRSHAPSRTQAVCPSSAGFVLAAAAALGCLLVAVTARQVQSVIEPQV